MQSNLSIIRYINNMEIFEKDYKKLYVIMGLMGSGKSVIGKNKKILEIEIFDTEINLREVYWQKHN